MESSLAALPEPVYLRRIGEIAYTVSYMEWTILGDLHHLADQLPPALELRSLEPLTVSGIATEVRKAAKKCEPGQVKDYLTATYKALFTAADIRNDVLHARPATTSDNLQRLLRAEVRNQRPTGAMFWIDEDWIDDAIVRLNEEMSAVSRVRPPVP